ncbi:MAG TPA: hypothetical protein EYG90_06015 [Campylobacterales bacterium]|nr:hypothetical protein [Campylobacterales bacterium]
MQGYKHLPIGYTIGSHYKIMRILEQDEAGVLYLVRDIRESAENRKEMFIPKAEFKEPRVEPSKEFREPKEKKPKKKFWFLKMLIVSIIILLGLGAYAYKIMEDEKKKPLKTTPTVVVKTSMPHPPLTNRDKVETSIPEKPKVETPAKKEVNAPNYSEYISEDELEVVEETSLEKRKKVEEPRKMEEPYVVEIEPTASPLPTPKITPRISLGTRIGGSDTTLDEF